MKNLRYIILLILVGTISMGVGIFLSKMKQTPTLPTSLNATVLDKPRGLSSFTLLDHDNNPFNQDSFKGQWSYLFFGYTNCPDVCPLALKVMQIAWETMPKNDDANNPVKMYFVSVDPDRDSTTLLKNYVTYYHPDFIGLTGEPNQLDNFTNQLGILYGFEDREKETDAYQVNHSAQFLLINPKGQLQAVISPPHESFKIASELNQIFDYYGEKTFWKKLQLNLKNIFSTT